MSEWEFAQVEPEQRLARVHHFSMVKNCDGAEVTFLISVKEYLTPQDPAMRFFAEADRQTNQKVAPYTPIGWGKTLLSALSECMREVERFPYQP